MRRINKLGRRAAAMALAVSMSLSVMPSVLAADAADAAPAASQAETQPADEQLPAEEPAQEEAADSTGQDTADTPVILPADSQDRKPVVIDPDQLPAQPDTDQPETPEEPAQPETPADSEAPSSSDAAEETPGDSHEDEIATYSKMHSGDCDFSQYVSTTAPTATEDGYDTYRCTKTYWFFGTRQCDETTKKNIVHAWSDWTETEATCETDGLRYRTCKNCGAVEHDTEYENAHKAAHTKGEELTEKRVEPTCTQEGSATYVCTVCGKEFTETLAKIPHTWGEYQDDDKPGCEQQTESQYCTVCGTRNEETTRDLPNFGADGNPLPHKFTHFTVDGVDQVATCDYCHNVTKRVKFFSSEIGDCTNLGLAAEAGEKLKVTAREIINQTLQDTQDKVNQAQTKEEATKALMDFKSSAASALQDKIKITVGSLEVGITYDQAMELLNNAIPSLDGVETTLNDSFLSKETIQAAVNKLVGSVTGEEGSNATEDAAYEIIRNVAYNLLSNTDNTDNTTPAKGLVTKLVSIAAGDDAGWDELTDAFVDDAVDLALDELMKDEKYAALLKTKLGAETMEEVRAEVKKQLVSDPTFMESVRGQVKDAADHAAKGVNEGWSDDKVLERLRADLLPLTDMVSGKITELGNGVNQVVDNKIDNTVDKILPGKLGDWISKKISGKVNGLVTGKIDDLGGMLNEMLTGYIKQFTCGSKHNQKTEEVIVLEPTCTEPGKKGVKCLNCGKIENIEEIPANGHTPVVDAAVEPTETSTGLTEGSHCSVCGAVLQAQETIPMLDPSIDTWFSRTATTEADAKAAGFDSVEAVNAAMDAALTAAGFDAANAEHFTVQVNSSIGVLPNDRFPDDGVTGKLTLPEGTKGKMAQTYYAVQVFTANNAGHKAGDVVVTPIKVKGSQMELTVYSEAVMAIAWKAQ